MHATTRTLLWNTLALLAWAPGCDPVSSNGSPDGGASPSMDAAPDARDPADAPATRRVTYVDVTEANLPPLSGLNMDSVAADVDADGDLDLITANLRPGLSLAADGFRAYTNDGSGRFTPATDDLFGALPPGKGFDVEAFDADGDGALDLFMASRGAQDRLYLRRLADR